MKINDIKEIKPVYLAAIVAVVVIIAVVGIWVGFLQPHPSQWEIQYLGMIDSNVVGEERQEHVNAFIQHNAGVGELCEITHFYLATCGACMYLEPWLNSFKERYPEVVISSYELTEPGVRVRFETIKHEYDLSSPSVPIIFACGTTIEGVGPIEDVFEPMALSVYSLPLRPVLHVS